MLQWKTPFEQVHHFKPDVSHLRVYGCKAYALKKNITRTAKLEDRALVGYLVGYDSRNIYRIWVPDKDNVIRTRDVTFDEDTVYDPSSKEVYYSIPEEEPATLEIPLVHPSNSDTESDEEEALITPPKSTTKEGESQAHLPTPSPLSQEDSHLEFTPQDSGGEDLPPSDSPPEPPPRRLLPVQYPTTPHPAAQPGNRAPRGNEIAGQISEHNIQTQPRNRRRNTYLAALQQATQGPSSFITAFMAGLSGPGQSITPKLHRDNLPPEPEHFSQVLTHPFKDQFMQAIQEEIQKLKTKGV